VRPIIRPGLQILRRDLRTLQVGLAWPGLRYLPDTPALQAVVAAIDGFRDAAGVVLAAAATGLPTDECSAALDLLVDVGAVVDRAATRRPDCGEPVWAALWLLAGPDATAADVLALRRSCAVHVPGTDPIADGVRELLPRAQIRLAAGPSDATLLVLTDAREPERSRSDDAMRAGLPHVWAYLRELVGVVGPFVVPGTTSCLRCVDCCRREVDPGWVAAISAAPRAVGVPPSDPVLAAVVAATVAQEVVAWASGYPPQTLDAVLEIPYVAGRVEHKGHPLHPQCGCGWYMRHDTMGA
jgi:bacteriocin biosynthesis cyclodehydratase domain-containing protein